MTIKNTNKNVSAENDEVVADVTYSNNGILTIVRKNLYHDTEIENKNVDLSDHKLKLKIVNQERLTALESSTNQNDIKERESYIFLVSLGESTSEGYYREYIWVQGNNGGEFEAIGSTKIDLTNYIQKSNTNGLIKNDGTIDTSIYLTTQDISGKADIVDLGDVAFSNDYSHLDNIPSSFTPKSHTHDDRYYTETEIDTALGNKANATHSHSSSNITDMAAVTVTITYTDNTTETLTLFKQVNNS